MISRDAPGSRRRRAVLVGLAVVLLVTSAAAGGWWAARTTLTVNTPIIEDNSEEILARAVDGSVGQDLTVGVTVSQPLALVASNQLSGVVTDVSDQSVFGIADMVYSVSAQPVRVITGSIPFYRALTVGNSGSDVGQLQDALRELGYSVNTNDQYTDRTATAVRTWQKDLREEPTGQIAFGSLISVPSLPSPLRLEDVIQLGATVTGGEKAVYGPSGDLTFSVTPSEGQAQQLTAGMGITVENLGTSWIGSLAEPRLNADATLEFPVVGPDGGPVCGSDCGQLAAVESSVLSGKVALVPAVQGVVIPAAAIRTDQSGNVSVLMADGTPVDVQVLGAGQGLVVVSGLQVGESVVISNGD